MTAQRSLRRQRHIRQNVLALAVPLLLAGVLAGTGPVAASASVCATWGGLQPPSPGTGPDQLNSVTVVSPCNAWAVGSSGNQTLIEHFNGARWAVVSSPTPVSVQAVLYGVRALSAGNVWAVGNYYTGTTDQHADPALDRPQVVARDQPEPRSEQQSHGRPRDRQEQCLGGRTVPQRRGDARP